MNIFGYLPQIQQVRKLESKNVFTDGLGPDVFKFTLKGHCLGESIKFTFPVNSVLGPRQRNRGPFVQSPYNFSGPKSNMQIETKGIRGVRVLHG